MLSLPRCSTTFTVAGSPPLPGGTTASASGLDAKSYLIACRQGQCKVQGQVVTSAIIQSHRHGVGSAFDQDASQKIHPWLAEEPGDELVARFLVKLQRRADLFDLADD